MSSFIMYLFTNIMINHYKIFENFNSIIKNCLKISSGSALRVKEFFKCASIFIIILENTKIIYFTDFNLYISNLRQIYIFMKIHFHKFGKLFLVLKLLILL